ncbi:MAG: hypothetical protein LR120_03690 [Dehalococcoidia bacterium]|nr:hypothetical protein [Dehalococcoidia bacterium]|tara:strand:- start:96 stop:344 length:249 start_codon:yes stop_codon:yes gene_type:complete
MEMLEQMGNIFANTHVMGNDPTIVNNWSYDIIDPDGRAIFTDGRIFVTPCPAGHKRVVEFSAVLRGVVVEIGDFRPITASDV